MDERTEASERKGTRATVFGNVDPPPGTRAAKEDGREEPLPRPLSGAMPPVFSEDDAGSLRDPEALSANTADVVRSLSLRDKRYQRVELSAYSSIVSILIEAV